jgi:hypothetical protein
VPGELLRTLKATRPGYTVRQTEVYALGNNVKAAARESLRSIYPDRKVDVYLICLFELKFGISLCPRLNLFMDQLVGYHTFGYKLK